MRTTDEFLIIQGNKDLRALSEPQRVSDIFQAGAFCVSAIFSGSLNLSLELRGKTMMTKTREGS